MSDDPVDVSEALTFGQLMCDLEVEQWEEFELDSYIEMLSELLDCFYRYPASVCHECTCPILVYLNVFTP